MRTAINFSHRRLVNRLEDQFIVDMGRTAIQMELFLHKKICFCPCLLWIARKNSVSAGSGSTVLTRMPVPNNSNRTDFGKSFFAFERLFQSILN